MTNPKRKTGRRGRDGPPPDYKVLPLRMETDLVTQLDEARERLGLGSRMDLFRRSLHAYLLEAGEVRVVARDFKEFIRVSGMTHVRTSPYYPQSNGKIERWHKTLKHTTIRPKAPNSLEEARRVVEEFVEHYNTVRLHSAIGYVTPADKLAGRELEIWQERDRKLEEA